MLGYVAMYVLQRHAGKCDLEPALMDYNMFILHLL